MLQLRTGNIIKIRLANIVISHYSNDMFIVKLSRAETEVDPMSDPQRFFLGSLSTEKESAEAVAATLLRVAGLAQSKGYAEGLKPSQWTALRYFASANATQRTVSAFATHQGSTRGAASQMVEILVGKGLLARSPSSEDRRVVRLEPTRAAEQLLARDPLAFLVRAIGELPKEEQHWMAVVLERLLKNMQIGA